MPVIKALEQRYSELTKQAEAIEATKRYRQSDYWSGDEIDSDLYRAWVVNAQHLISISCGDQSVHYQKFKEALEPKSYASEYNYFKYALGVFNAAKDDYLNGYLNTVKSLVQAELFDNELDQARELLAGGYISAAAVVAGVVLETTLREMCKSAGLPIGKLDKMNADLAKAGKYTLLVQKRITALADIRNNAAHGKPDQFSKDDVSDMISKVEAFITDYV